MAKGRSTSENPAEQSEAADDTVVGPPEPVEEGSGIETAKIAAATGVMYVGTAHVREIDAAAWKQAGVDDQKKVVWDNRYRGKNIVPLSSLSAGAIEYLDLYDDGFVLVDENGKRV